MCILPIGDERVDGGDNGNVADGSELFRLLTGLQCSGSRKVGRDIIRGEGGGDGVDVVDRNVGPGPAGFGGPPSF